MPKQGHEPPGGFYRVYFSVEGEPMHGYRELWAVSKDDAKERVQSTLNDEMRADNKEREIVDTVLLHGKIGDDF